MYVDCIFCLCVCVCVCVCARACMNAFAFFSLGLSIQLRSQIHSIKHRVCVYLGVAYSLVRSQVVIIGIMKRTQARQTKNYCFILSWCKSFNFSAEQPD